MPAQQQMANSPYVGLDARETLDSYLRRTRRIRAVAVVAIVAVAAFAMATRLLDSVAGTLLYFLLLVLVVLLCALAVAKAFFGLQQVLTNDCDPQKLLDICLALMQRGRRGRGRALRNMQSICAVCCSNLGRSEDALDWVEAFETSGKLDVQLRLTAISVRLAAARRRADWEEVRHLSERAREMGAAGGKAGARCGGAHRRAGQCVPSPGPGRPRRRGGCARPRAGELPLSSASGFRRVV